MVNVPTPRASVAEPTSAHSLPRAGRSNRRNSPEAPGTGGGSVETGGGVCGTGWGTGWGVCGTGWGVCGTGWGTGWGVCGAARGTAVRVGERGSSRAGAPAETGGSGGAADATGEEITVGEHACASASVERGARSGRARSEWTKLGRVGQLARVGRGTAARPDVVWPHERGALKGLCVTSAAAVPPALLLEAYPAERSATETGPETIAARPPPSAPNACELRGLATGPEAMDERARGSPWVNGAAPKPTGA